MLHRSIRTQKVNFNNWYQTEVTNTWSNKTISSVDAMLSEDWNLSPSTGTESLTFYLLFDCDFTATCFYENHRPPSRDNQELEKRACSDNNNIYAVHKFRRCCQRSAEELNDDEERAGLCWFVCTQIYMYLRWSRILFNLTHIDKKTSETSFERTPEDEQNIGETNN